MTAFVLVVWLCSAKATVCDPAHALRVLRSTPMGLYVCTSSAPHFFRATRAARSAAACERISPEV